MTHYEGYDERTSGSDLLIFPPSISMSKQFGQVPRLLAANAGFFSVPRSMPRMHEASSASQFRTSVPRARAQGTAEEAPVRQRSEMAHRLGEPRRLWHAWLHALSFSDLVGRPIYWGRLAGVQCKYRDGRLGSDTVNITRQLLAKTNRWVLVGYFGFSTSQ